jgi:TPP-dependent pyruvate/acetoin dehydrogenase alpha subunit
LFVCENNEYAIYSHVSARMAGYGLCDRYRTYGVPCEKDESGDFLKMYEVAGRAIADVRKGYGPRFIEISTTRWRDHVGPGEDRHHDYRCEIQLDAAILGDQVTRIGAMLRDVARDRIDVEVEREIAEAVAFADESPFPRAEEVFEHVFAASR